MNALRTWFERATLYPAGPDTQANARASLLDGMAFNVMTGAFLPYVGPFLLAMGANAFAISLSVALPALVQTLSQFPGAAIAARAPRRVPLIVRWSWAGRLGYLPLAAVPFLPIPPAAQVFVFLAIYAYMSFPGTVANVAWTALMAEIFPPRLRGRVFADRNMWLTAATLVASLLSGLIVGVFAWPWYYAVLIGLTFAGQVASIVYLGQLREPEGSGAASRETVAAPAGFTVRSEAPGSSRAASRDRAADAAPPQVGAGSAARDPERGGDAGDWRRFWSFSLPCLVLQAGMAWAQGIWPIIFIDIDGLPVFWFGVWSTVSSLATILSVRAWGRRHDRHGPVALTILTALIFVVTVPAYLFVRDGVGISLLNVLGGIGTAGMNLALFNGLLETAPASDRPRAVAWFNLMIGLANFAAPLLGAAQFHALGLAATLWTASGLRLAAAAMLGLPGIMLALRARPQMQVQASHREE